MLVDMNCTEEQQRECPYNHDDTCNGSCSLQEELAERLYWYEAPKGVKTITKTKEATTMTEEYEKVDTSLENAITLEIGDELEGELTAIEEGNYGPNYRIKTADGEKLLFGKTILNTAMKRVEAGNLVKIKRIDDRKTGTGRIAQDFEVYFKKKAGA